MKKKSRFLTGLLSAVMALSLCALPAAAEGTQTRVPTLPAINTDTTGTLTIHKYEYNGTSTSNGTGEATDSSKVPTDEPNAATPLDGVTFTLYKVMDADQLQAYYDNTQAKAINSVTIDTYVVNNKIKEPSKYSEKNGNLFTAITGETGKAGTGTAKIELPVGMYAVVETNVPAARPPSPMTTAIPSSSTLCRATPTTRQRRSSGRTAAFCTMWRSVPRRRIRSAPWPPKPA